MLAVRGCTRYLVHLSRPRPGFLAEQNEAFLCLADARDCERVGLRHTPKTHGSREDAQTNVLTGTPSSVKVRHLDPRKPQFGDRSEGSGRNARFDRTNKVVKTVENAGHDHIGDTNSTMVANL